ncbi:ABC transporter substrate-binding protein [Algoriphagus sp. PAP.12]|uniref:ABC transporter substrate-binding protein n=1 Tax=Algoriphagus sp. PAP.12 TaxID=2996678 RepID=UPI00227C434C|nr:ABC transporter substrate-binding protein [Algoriphagus sp. PAP.12]
MIILFSCAEKSAENENLTLENIPLSYAQGFDIQEGEGFWILTVNQPWKGAKQSFKYLVLEEGKSGPEGEFNGVIQLPVEEVILTSTTQIPHLDLLGETQKMIAFPNLDLISSEKVWERIDQNLVKDLGSAPSANVEMILEMEPDWMMVSTLGEDMRNMDLLNQSGIPTPINGEYVEQHPLGRAEWIKFTGVLLGKYEEADSVFGVVEKAYLEAEELVKSIPDAEKPTVLTGVLYQDIWYAPGSESWGAKILENAGGNYIFKEQKGTGSLELNYEYVLDQSMNSKFWIGSADFNSLQEMGEAEPRYKVFKAFKEGNVFTYTAKKGPKGGFEYFELGYMRPDWVLKDLIKIIHPNLLPDYQLYFYNQLNEN